MLGHALHMAIPLRGGGLSRLARHGRGTRRHHDRRLAITLGDRMGNAFLIIGAIGGERCHGSRNLIEQGANLRTVVDLLCGQRSRDNLAGVGVQTNVQFAPGPARPGAMFLDQPLACTTEFQARAVHQQVKRLAVTARSWARHLQRFRPAAQGGVVRHGQSEPEQVDDGTDQSLGLPQRQVGIRPARSVLSRSPGANTTAARRGSCVARPSKLRPPQKKTIHANEQARPDVARRREQCRRRQGRIDPTRLVFIDETWTKTNMAPLRGWSEKGQRLVGRAPCGHWNTMTFLAALRHDRIDAPFLLDGPINKVSFMA